MTRRRKREPALAMGAVALVAMACGLAGGAALMSHAPRAAPETFAPRALPLTSEMRLAPPDVVATPAHLPPAPDEWTDEAPVLQARLAPARLAPPPAPPAMMAPTPPSAGAPPPPPADRPSDPATPPALTLAQTDDRKICVKAPANLDVAPAPPAPLRLHYEPTLRHPALDIAPVGPAPEEERRIRLSALLAEALQQ